MVNAPQNFDEAKVYLLPVTHMNFKPGMTVETATHTPITLAIQMKTFLEENDDPIMFTDCAEVPYQVTLSDNKNFEVVERYRKFTLNETINDLIMMIFFLISSWRQSHLRKLCFIHCQGSQTRNNMQSFYFLH